MMLSVWMPFWLASSPLWLMNSLVAPGVRDDPRLTQVRTLDSRHDFVPPDSAAAWEHRRELLRRRVLVAAGLWPLPERTPLDARSYGKIDRGDYTVERVAFASWPGHWVTGNLYRPAGEGPFAGVLCPHGHWDAGRFCRRGDDEVRGELSGGGEWREANARYHLQARCATLARLGCVVLHYDMVGYGDSRRLPHGAGFEDAEALLWGQSALGLQTWNSIRALDYLLSQEQVDPERIGVTGGSGGGTQTFLLGAVDPRPAALVPAVMVSTGMQGGCVCENAPHLRVGCGNVDLAALAAPRPLGLIGADDWTRDIEERGLPQLRHLYRVLGVPESLDAWVHVEYGHNYNAVSRAHVYRFFDRHLALGNDLEQHPLRSRAMEERFVPVAPEELSAAASLPEGLDGRDLRVAWKRRQEAAWQELLPDGSGDLPRWRRSVEGALEVLIPAERPGELVLRAAASGREGWRSVQQPDGRQVEVREWKPTGPVRGALLWVGESIEPEAVDRHATRLARDAGLLIVEVATLFEHEGGSLPVDGGRHGRYAGYTWTYNRTLLAERCGDVALAARYARQCLPLGSPVLLFGTGWAGPGALLAAARNPAAFDRVALRWDWSLQEIESIDDPRLLPGALAFGGIAGLGSAFAPGALAVVGQEPPAILERVWQAHGQASNLRAVPDERAAVAWLVEGR